MQRKNYKKKSAFPDGSRLRIGIVVAEFNGDITGRMLNSALETLAACKVKKGNITVVHVPGGFQSPFGCRMLLEKGHGKSYDALIAIGCVIKGETTHDVYIANVASQGILEVSLAYGVPIIFGVITTNNLAQAKVRFTGQTNKGIEAALPQFGWRSSRLSFGPIFCYIIRAMASTSTIKARPPIVVVMGHVRPREDDAPGLYPENEGRRAGSGRHHAGRGRLRNRAHARRRRSAENNVH